MDNSLKIAASAFENGGNIPEKFTCDGEDVSPELIISGTPEGTKSLAIIVDDPDAPMGNFNHWVMWNIGPGILKIEENGVPEGAIVGTNDGEKNEYMGPCPPSGTHRYYFKLYALDTSLDLAPSSKKSELEVAMEGHILGEAEMMAKYAR